jgi:hypothetical protein
VNLSAFSMGVILMAGPVVAVAQDIDTAYHSLQQAVEKKDVDAVKTLVPEASKYGREVAAEAEPAAAAEKEAWKKRVAYGKDVDQFSEYALYAMAIQQQPAGQVELFSMLEKQNPKSKYLNEGYSNYIAALSQSGGAAKVTEVAEKGLASLPENEDLLYVVANAALARKQNDRAASLANRLTAAMNKHSKPEGVSAADWDRKRATMLGRGYWISGVVAAEKNQFAIADKNLRASLPYIKGDTNMAGPAYFYLGVANYQLGKMTLSKAKVLEGAKFSEESAKIQGPYQQQAWRNAALIKTDADKMR